jgi:hypothetical protein
MFQLFVQDRIDQGKVLLLFSQLLLLQHHDVPLKSLFLSQGTENTLFDRSAIILHEDRTAGEIVPHRHRIGDDEGGLCRDRLVGTQESGLFPVGEDDHHIHRLQEFVVPDPLDESRIVDVRGRGQRSNPLLLCGDEELDVRKFTRRTDHLLEVLIYREARNHPDRWSPGDGIIRGDLERSHGILEDHAPASPPLETLEDHPGVKERHRRKSGIEPVEEHVKRMVGSLHQRRPGSDMRIDDILRSRYQRIDQYRKEGMDGRMLDEDGMRSLAREEKESLYTKNRKLEEPNPLVQLEIDILDTLHRGDILTPSRVRPTQEYRPIFFYLHQVISKKTSSFG